MNPPPSKDLNIRTFIIVLTKGRGFLNQGFGLLPKLLEGGYIGFRVLGGLGFRV